MFRLIAVLLLLAAPALAQSPNPSFNLVNKATQPITQLHLSPAGRATFGTRNWIAAPLAPAAKVPVRLPADGNCIFDLRATFADKTEETRRTLNLCTTDDVAFAGVKPAKAPDDPSFTLINPTAQAVIELTATPAGKTRGANLLAAPVAPGAQAAVKPERGICVFDVRYVLADRTTIKIRRNTDLCKLADLTVVP
jgi:hypothetical protein